jgi:tetratricopeptide (TPR) repeat protein
MSPPADMALQELVDAHLIHPISDAEPSFLFNHVLMQDAAYQSLLLRDRRYLHLRVAAAFEQAYASDLDAHAPALAYHYGRGEDWHKTARFARRAGERAFQVYALREAIGYYAQALQALRRLPDASGEDICDVIVGWSQAAFGFEPFPKLLEELKRAEEWARRLQDKRRLATVLLMIGKVHVASGHPSHAAPALVECFALATEMGDDQLAVLPTFSMGMVTFDSEPRRAIIYFDKAAELARQYRDVDTEAYALAMKALVEARLGEVNTCEQNLAQALRQVDRISPVTSADVHMAAAWAQLDLGKDREALENARQCVQQAISTDAMECACLGYACLGFGHLRAQQMTEAISAFEEAIRRSKISGAEDAQILGESGLSMARFFSGSADGTQELERALGHARGVSQQFAAALLEQTLGEIHLQRGDAAQAIAHLGEALEYYRKHRMRFYLARTLTPLADALERRGESDRAKELRVEREVLLRET